MAVFTQKLWKDGRVQFPGRRKLTNVSDSSTKTVQVSREEGNIYVKGDEFNAASLNNLESRLAKAFNDAESKVKNSAALINMYYPVGKILYSLVDFKLEQSGHTMFPGTTWVRIQDGRAVAPSSVAGTTSGNETASFALTGTAGIRSDSSFVGYHQTTVEEMPKHSHSYVDKDWKWSETRDRYTEGSIACNSWMLLSETYTQQTIGGAVYPEHTHTIGLQCTFTPNPATVSINLRQRGLKVYAWQRTK